MNNEMNNNVNNGPVNSGGVNFVHAEGLVDNTMSSQPEQVVTQTMVTQEGPMAMPGAPAEPQPIMATSISFVSGENQVPNNPEPVNFVSETPAASNLEPVNFVSSKPQVVSNSEPVNFASQTPVTSNPTPVQPAVVSNPFPASSQAETQPIQSTMPQPSPTPVMPQQPVVPPTGNIPPQMPSGPLQSGGNSFSENKGGNKAPIIMIIITILVVVGVVVFLVLYLSGKIKFGGNNNQNNEQPAVVDNKSDEVILADWMNYILEQNITEVKLTRYVDVDDSIMASLTSGQLKEIFTKMNSYTLTRDYSDREDDSDDELEVVYAIDEETFSFKIVGKYIEYDDNKVEEIFNKVENTRTEDDDVTDEESNYVLENFDATIYNSYFESQEG